MATSPTQTMATATTSGSSIPSSSCNQNTSVCGIPSPGMLYLFTFLATLLMLIILAAAIISRSVYLRRRQRQLIASGQWVPPGQREKGEVNLKKRPRMFDAHVAAVVYSSDLKQWELILPLSAGYESPPAVILGASENAHEGESSGAAVPTLTTVAGTFLRPRRTLSPNITVPALVPPPPQADAIPLPDTEPKKLRAQLAYIIAMPVEERPSGEHYEAEMEVPFVEFGITEVDVVQNHDKQSLSEGEVEGKTSNAESISPVSHEATG
ncbi:hypothetical protein C8R44DRAFT_823142 [Mycena epipterygia]|nr:hypothetical protein C8R44DRAFT_823142 [Mycena epipterygia]